MWRTYQQPATFQEALAILNRHRSEAAVIAGGTDVLVEYEHGRRKTPVLVDITRLSELKYVREAGGTIRLGALATHNDVIASPVCVERALPLAQACWEVGAPQLRTRATVAGNVVTSSPANDTITPLMALNAEVVLASSEGERVLPLSAFSIGVRKTALRPNEVVREIRFPALGPAERGIFLKLGLRRAQAIAVVNVAVVVRFAGSGHVAEARIALGSVAPTIVRAVAAEAFLRGKMLTPENCAEAGRRALDAAAPIDDVRGSARYRRQTLANLVTHALERIAAGTERQGWPATPVLLETPFSLQEAHSPYQPGAALVLTVNGECRALPASAAHKSLLDAIREDAGLTGTKEGCAEGECGACTVWLNGQAVMACLVPAPQAHGAVVTTIEGLASAPAGDAQTSPDGLHPLQAAFIAHGAVQCGYCIPGMLMAGAKLLEEVPRPDRATIQFALSGNICRCTGYRKILDAVQAAGRGAEHP